MERASQIFLTGYSDSGASPRLRRRVSSSAPRLVFGAATGFLCRNWFQAPRLVSDAATEASCRKFISDAASGRSRRNSLQMPQLDSVTAKRFWLSQLNYGTPTPSIRRVWT
jgi:hypothetical protein